MLRASGPVEMQPVGETEFVNGVAAMSASGFYGTTRACAGIVGHADLTLGSRVEPVLAAHIRAGGDRFRGIRHITAWDADTSIRNPAYSPAAGPPGRQGLPRRASPCSAGSGSPSTPGSTTRRSVSWPISRAPSRNARIVLNHVGGPIGIGAYAGKHKEVFPVWAAVDQGARRLPQRLRQARRARHAPRRLRLPRTARAAIRRRRSRRHGVPTSRPASRRSGRRAACSRATSPSTRAPTATRCSGTPASCSPRAPAPTEKADLFAGTAARFYRLDLPGIA